MQLSIIVPAFNEERTLPQIMDKLPALPLNKEIIAIDDASTDHSLTILQNLSEKGQIIFFHHAVNMGKGVAVRTGSDRSTHDLLPWAGARSNPSDRMDLSTSLGIMAQLAIPKY